MNGRFNHGYAAMFEVGGAVKVPRVDGGPASDPETDDVPRYSGGTLELIGAKAEAFTGGSACFQNSSFAG